MRLKTTEAGVLKACLQLLDLRGIFAWRNNSGALPNAEGRPVRFGKPGSSDIFGILPGGRFLAVECKRPGGKPTATQAVFLESIRVAGGVALVIDDPRELDAFLDLIERGTKRA